MILHIVARQTTDHHLSTVESFVHGTRKTKEYSASSHPAGGPATVPGGDTGLLPKDLPVQRSLSSQGMLLCVEH